MTKLNKILDELHVRLGEELLEKLRSGKARASDLNVARQFLRDNNIDCVPVEGSPLQQLADELPFRIPETKAKLPN